MPPRAARALAILGPTGALAVGGCGSASPEVEQVAGSAAAALQAAAGPLCGLIGQL